MPRFIICYSGPRPHRLNTVCYNHGGKAPGIRKGDVRAAETCTAGTMSGSQQVPGMSTFQRHALSVSSRVSVWRVFGAIIGGPGLLCMYCYCSCRRLELGRRTPVSSRPSALRTRAPSTRETPSGWRHKLAEGVASGSAGGARWGITVSKRFAKLEKVK